MAGKLKLLVVDDEEALRTIVHHELEAYGFKVDVAEDGEVALQKLVEKKFDVVILDIYMPGMDGMEVLRKIREENQKTKVIMLTGVKELKLAKESLALGANDFVTKPYEFKNLLACIDRVMKE